MALAHTNPYGRSEMQMNYLFFVLFVYWIKINFVPNCHVKTSSLKTDPPTNVEMTFCMAVWVWTAPLITQGICLEVAFTRHNFYSINGFFCLFFFFQFSFSCVFHIFDLKKYSYYNKIRKYHILCILNNRSIFLLLFFALWRFFLSAGLQRGC